MARGGSVDPGSSPTGGGRAGGFSQTGTRHGAGKVPASQDHGDVSQAAPAPLDEPERLLSLQVALKCADIGSIAEELENHVHWVYCLEEEFFSQGDMEKEMGLPISPLFDRDKPGVSKSQLGFFDIIAIPMFHNFSRAFPGCKPMMDLIMTNYRYWKSQAPSVQGHSQEVAASPPSVVVKPRLQPTMSLMRNNRRVAAIREVTEVQQLPSEV